METTQTTGAPLSTVIGVFPNHELADRAIDELRRTHFSYERIRVVERGTGGFADTLKGMFTGQAAMVSNTAESLVKMGMPEYEAQYYQRELDADHVLVLMNADDRPEAAFSVMRQNGAFDINSRLRMAAESAPRREGEERERERERMSSPPGTTTTTHQAPFAPAPGEAPATRYDQGARAERTPTPQRSRVAYDERAAREETAPTPAPTSSDPELTAEQSRQELPRNS